MVDFRAFAVICIACYAALRTTEAGCKDDLIKSEKPCFNSYNTYLANLGNSGADMTQITSLLCNEEAQEATKCLLPLLESCNELKADSQFQIFTILEQMGGCQTMGFGVPRTTEVSCKGDLMKSEKSCFDSYNIYLANIGNRGADMTQITSLLCNEEGRAATKCLIPLLENCKELKADYQFQMFTILEQMGGCQAVGVGGGPGMSVCTNASMECFSMSGNSEEADQKVSNAPTQFNKFQEEIKTICGELKTNLECMKKYEKLCPDLEKQYKQTYTTGMQQGGSDEPYPTFDSQKKFVMNECPKFPADFSTNACLMDNLQTKQFTECYKNAINESETKLTCDQYKGAFDCVKTALKTCDDKHKSAFTATTNFYLAAQFTDGCKVEMMKETSGARVFVLSLYTMLIAIFLRSFF